MTSILGKLLFIVSKEYGISDWQQDNFYKICEHKNENRIEDLQKTGLGWHSWCENAVCFQATGRRLINLLLIDTLTAYFSVKISDS